MDILFALLMGLFCLALTPLWLGVLRRLSIIDTPNARSSHHTPTPKGGGAVFASLISLGLIVYASSSPGEIGAPLTALAATGLAIAVCGLIDDIQGLPVLPRLIVQLGGATGIASTLYLGTPEPTRDLAYGLTLLVAIPGIVWATNLYNFMDGIDGLAALQAVLAGLTIAGLYYSGLYSGQLAVVALLVAVTVGGFLVFNFPTAKVFMGDTGSAYLGFIFAGLAIIDRHGAAETFWLWAMALAWFLCDATLTLANRIVRGERFYEAHRSHAYQHLAGYLEQRFLDAGHPLALARRRAHRCCLLAFSAIYLLWQLPLIVLTAKGHINGPVGLAVVCVPYVYLALRLGAGRSSPAVSVDGAQG